MALAEQVAQLDEEIKTKTASWLKMADEAEAAEEGPSAEQVETLQTGNKELSALKERRKGLADLLQSKEVVKADTAQAEADREDALKQSRKLGNRKGVAAEEAEEEPWSVKAAKALIEDHPTQKDPYTVNKSLKALFQEGTFTAASGSVPGYYSLGTNDQGYPPELRRDPALFTPAAVRPVQFWNTIQQISTDRPTDVYMLETVNTDSSDVFVGEGGVYVEDDGFDYTEQSNPIKDVGTYYAVTRDMLEDEPMMQSILEMRVMERVSRKIDNACLNNTSGNNKFAGVLQLSGLPSFAKDGGDSIQVAITRAMEAINGPAVTGITGSGGQAVADAIYVTVPTYWEFLRQQDALGNFMVSSGLREAPQLRVAGVPVMQCQALPAGNILVMDRMYTHIRDRRQVDVYWMEQLDSQGNQTRPTARRMVVADARLTITVRRLAANCRITGA